MVFAIWWLRNKCGIEEHYSTLSINLAEGTQNATTSKAVGR
jgi:hypothetical protein